MDKIGNRIVIDTKSFLVPAGESIWLTLNAQGWIVRLNITFEPQSETQGIRIEPQSDYARLVFSKWDNPIGSATIQPVELGTHQDGRKLFFMAINYSIGGTNKFEIQFLLGETV